MSAQATSPMIAAGDEQLRVSIGDNTHQGIEMATPCTRPCAEPTRRSGQASPKPGHARQIPYTMSSAKPYSATVRPAETINLQKSFI